MHFLRDQKQQGNFDALRNYVVWNFRRPTTSMSALKRPEMFGESWSFAASASSDSSD